MEVPPGELGPLARRALAPRLERIGRVMEIESLFAASMEAQNEPDPHPLPGTLRDDVSLPLAVGEMRRELRELRGEVRSLRQEIMRLSRQTRVPGRLLDPLSPNLYNDQEHSALDTPRTLSPFTVLEHPYELQQVWRQPPIAQADYYWIEALAREDLRAAQRSAQTRRWAIAGAPAGVSQQRLQLSGGVYEAAA
jgi:hypothetical protein